MAYEDKTPMPFGAHAGAKLEDVPARYLLWLWDAGLWRVQTKPDRRALHDYIKDAFSALESEAKDYIVEHRPTR